jgi:hypothetical protein
MPGEVGVTRSWGVGRSGKTGRELFIARNAERVVLAARADIDRDDALTLAGWVTDEAVASPMNPQAMRMHEINNALRQILGFVEARYRAAA